MTQSQVKRRVVSSALTSYARIVVRMALGLVTFRVLYQGMSGIPEQFGFWSLLWAVFGYGILLDFGFAYAAQKKVAQLSATQSWAELSRVLSTIFFSYVILGVAATAICLALSGPLIDLFKVSAANRESYRQVMMVFIAGIGLALPLGVFPEILNGQQRISTANNINILGSVANFVAVLVVFWLKLGFMALVLASLACILLPNMLAAWMAMRHMPGVVIRPGLFSRQAMLETSRFSLFAYANTLSNVLRNKTDQPMISALLGVAQVTAYQGGSKVGEMFGFMTKQIADVLSPSAAHLHAKGDSEAYREMMLGGIRYSVMVATPLFIVAAAYMEGALRLLTGEKHPTGPMLWSAELLVFWYYSLTLTHRVFKSMFMMAGGERKIMLQSVAEAVTNLLMSAGFTIAIRTRFGSEWGITGVALGSLVPTLLFGWTLLWGWTAKQVQMTRTALFSRCILRTWMGCIPMVVVAAALRLQPLWNSGGNTFLVLLEGTFVTGVGALGIWFITLSRSEREKLLGAVRRKLDARRNGKVVAAA